MTTSQIPREICCQTCQIAESGNAQHAYDFQCADCVVRYALHVATSLGTQYGGPEHVARIKDKLAEKLRTGIGALHREI